MSDTTAVLPPLFPAAGEPVAAPRSVTWSREAKRLGGLHAWLKGAAIANAIALVLLAGLGGALLWVYAALEGGAEFSELQLAAFDTLTGYADIIIRPIYLITLVLSGFLYCRFIYRALENLDKSRAHGDRIGSGWAVAYNFIPIMNLWKPLQAMSQAWRGSLDPDRNRIAPPQVTGVWWAFWLISNFIANISFRMAIESGAFGEVITNFELFKQMLWLDIFSAIATLLSVLFLLPIISGIARTQDERMNAR